MQQRDRVNDFPFRFLRILANAFEDFKIPLLGVLRVAVVRSDERLTRIQTTFLMEITLPATQLPHSILTFFK